MVKIFFFFFQLEFFFFRGKYFEIWHFEKIFSDLRFWKFWDFEILKNYFEIWDFGKIFSDFEKNQNFKCWDFENKIEIFQIFRFFQKFRPKKISTFSKFIITSKSCFVINFHSILIILVCMNSYQIRRIVSTCLNIRTTIIKEVIAD